MNMWGRRQGGGEAGKLPGLEKGSGGQSRHLQEQLLIPPLFHFVPPLKITFVSPLHSFQCLVTFCKVSLL